LALIASLLDKKKKNYNIMNVEKEVVAILPYVICIIAIANLGFNFLLGLHKIIKNHPPIRSQHSYKGVGTNSNRK